MVVKDSQCFVLTYYEYQMDGSTLTTTYCRESVSTFKINWQHNRKHVLVNFLVAASQI